MLASKSKIYIILVTALIVGLAAGYLLGCQVGRNKAYRLGFEQGQRELEAEYEQRIATIFPSIPEPTEIYSVFGKITNIQGKTITLEQTIYSSNPLKEPEKKLWTISVTDDTELVKRVNKTPEELIEGDTVAPIPFKEEEVEFSELTVGKEITVEAGENIKGKTEFEAKKVIFSMEI